MYSVTSDLADFHPIRCNQLFPNRPIGEEGVGFHSDDGGSIRPHLDLLMQWLLA